MGTQIVRNLILNLTIKLRFRLVTAKSGKDRKPDISEGPLQFCGIESWRQWFTWQQSGNGIESWRQWFTWQQSGNKLKSHIHDLGSIPHKRSLHKAVLRTKVLSFFTGFSLLSLYICAHYIILYIFSNHKAVLKKILPGFFRKNNILSILRAFVKTFLKSRDVRRFMVSLYAEAEASSAKQLVCLISCFTGAMQLSAVNGAQTPALIVPIPSKHIIFTI